VVGGRFKKIGETGWRIEVGRKQKKGHQVFGEPPPPFKNPGSATG
jgi:hypothetical protein